ncbi:MAG: fructose-bisphosphate aldolase, class [Microbacteriaceae bacterium]|jgi:fructose-bisphosphate aldolase class II|nr:fructose-bisphosphate aldolase, class [Microbacteriaceae bacterium]
MTLAPTRELMRDAARAGSGIGAFNVIHLETAEALVAGAERAGLPVILQISENCARYHGGLEPIALASLAVARAASVPVAVHLDHAEDEKLAYQAVDLGFGSVMYDGAHLDYAENLAITARVVEYAHARGVFVEAELGKVGGKDGAHAPGVRTDPDEAVSFVAATGVDALAVAVGSSHAMTERSAALDLELIARLHAALDVPLVLHGSSGVSDETLVGAIRTGMTKINVSTHLNGFFTAAIRRYLDENPAVVDSRRYVSAGRASVTGEAARLIRMFATASGDTFAAAGDTSAAAAAADVGE